jgi:hypothetical protein
MRQKQTVRDLKQQLAEKEEEFERAACAQVWRVGGRF